MIKKISKYFKFLQIGFESADEETLKSMAKARKPFNDSQLANALFQNGVMPHAFLMTGFPPEQGAYQGKDRNEYVNFYVRSGLRTLEWLVKNKDVVGTYKATRLVLPRDSGMVAIKEGVASVEPEYAHEIMVRQPRDLEYNVPYEKRNGSREMDKALTALFDLIQTPYRAFTHHAIYHQRQFMWEEGIKWSKEHPDDASQLYPIDGERTKRALHQFWKAAVGKTYIEAKQELAKKSGISQSKKVKLEQALSDIHNHNTIATWFPEGIPSIETLLRKGIVREAKEKTTKI